MKAVVFDQCGAPADVLKLTEKQAPTPRRGEVRARMLASPVNPSDILYIRGQYGKQARFPATPGFEGVGIVEESGGGFLGWRVKGRRVAILNAHGGNWQEQVIIPARQAVPVPTELSDEQAATFFVNPASAVVMTRYVLRIPKGAWLLQSAANGALGRMVIRLAKEHGFRTINVVRRPELIDELKREGANEVLCCSPEEIPDQVMKLTNGEGVPFAIDPVGGAVGSALFLSLSPSGRMLVYGTLTNEPLSIPPRLMISGNRRLEGFWLSVWARSQSSLKMLKLFRRLNKLFRQGIVATDIGSTYTLDRIAEAVQEAEQPGRSGKVLLRIGDTSQ